jgi:hypothetical protein
MRHVLASRVREVALLTPEKVRVALSIDGTFSAAISDCSMPNEQCQEVQFNRSSSRLRVDFANF